MPIFCCTATATKAVREDVITTLGLQERNMLVFEMTTSRPNLHYEVRYKNDEMDHYTDFLGWYRKVIARRQASQRSTQLTQRGDRVDNVSGIIYTLYRRDCEALAEQLARDGVGAKPYHAGLTTAQKDEYLDGWVTNRAGYDIIVATTAFGMGIDKTDVRFVVHWQIPKSFEGFYQEAGRAGRDGKASACIMYYSREDRQRAVNTLEMEFQKKSRSVARGARDAVEHIAVRAASLKRLVEFCEDVGRCRHQLICDYFGEKKRPVCDYACDWHKDAEGLGKMKRKNLISDEEASTQGGAYPVDDG